MHQLVGLLWTSYQLITETSTREHTMFTRDKQPCPQQDLNPQSQQATVLLRLWVRLHNHQKWLLIIQRENCKAYPYFKPFSVGSCQGCCRLSDLVSPLFFQTFGLTTHGHTVSCHWIASLISLTLSDTARLGPHCIISGFCCKVDEICVLLGYYTAYSGNSLPTYQDNLSAPSSRICLTLEAGTDGLSHNVGQKFLLYTM